jgi:glycosyltransferase involved in cell wall biosynthesis
MARICVLNNYPIEKMWHRARAGLAPRQHIWGVDALAERGDAVDFAPFHEPSERNALDRLGVHSRGLLGHLDQEAYAIRRILKTDLFYCADQNGLAGLSLMRRVLPRVRLVSVIHHPVRRTPRLAAAARHDTLVCLSPALCSDLDRDLPRRRRPKLAHLPWGPDLGDPVYRSSGEHAGVVSAGKSNRDLVTLSEALRRTNAPGLVYDLARRLSTPPNRFVKVVHPGDLERADPDSPGGYLAHHVIADTAAAAIVAIPVTHTGRLTGLTEAADALALGKPIVATRSAYFPFDIEAEGCGIWVEPHDADGWARAIGDLMSDPAARAEMGAAGRRFAERAWNYTAFCNGLCELIPS